MKKSNLERQLGNAVTSSKGLIQQQKTVKAQLEAIRKEIADLVKEKQDLSKDMKDIEAESFKDFCKTAKVKHIQQYEDSLSSFGKANGQEDLFQ